MSKHDAIHKTGKYIADCNAARTKAEATGNIAYTESLDVLFLRYAWRQTDRVLITIRCFPGGDLTRQDNTKITARFTASQTGFAKMERLSSSV